MGKIKDFFEVSWMVIWGLFLIGMAISAIYYLRNLIVGIIILIIAVGIFLFLLSLLPEKYE